MAKQYETPELVKRVQVDANWLKRNYTGMLEILFAIKQQMVSEKHHKST